MRAMDTRQVVASSSYQDELRKLRSQRRAEIRKAARHKAEREAFLQQLVKTWGGSIEELHAIDAAAGKPTPGGNVWPNGMD